jgi:hypothetical protein
MDSARHHPNSPRQGKPSITQMLYQGRGLKMDDDRQCCESIIRALRHGLVPTQGLERIAVGRTEELRQIRRDLAYSKSGGAWVRFLSGQYGSGKTFLCSLVREIAWQEGFVVAAVVLGREAPLHKFEIIYHRIMDGMRTDHVRDVPAFEFIVQEWLFRLEQGVRDTMGLNPSDPQHWSKISGIIAQQINEQLLGLHIYNSSVANALHAYYVAVRQVNEPMIAAAAAWLKGEPHLPSELCKELRIQDSVDKDNAFQFLQSMATLVVHIGYAGLIVICDEAEMIRGISRPDSRKAACENISILIDKTAQGEFAHCGFIIAAAENLFREDLHAIASYRPVSERLKRGKVESGARDEQQPLILLKGFDLLAMYEIAQSVRGVHGIAYDWDPTARLTDGLLQQLVKETGARFGEKFVTIPRGFLKVFIDMLDALRQNPHQPAAEVLARGIDADRVEEVEREEAHLLNHS